MVHWIIQKTDFWYVPWKSKTKSKSIKTQTLAKIFQVNIMFGGGLQIAVIFTNCGLSLYSEKELNEIKIR